VAQKFHFAILRIEVTHASRGVSAIAELYLLAFLRNENNTATRQRSNAQQFQASFRYGRRWRSGRCRQPSS